MGDEARKHSFSIMTLVLFKIQNGPMVIALQKIAKAEDWASFEPGFLHLILLVLGIICTNFILYESVDVLMVFIVLYIRSHHEHIVIFRNLNSINNNSKGISLSKYSNYHYKHYIIYSIRYRQNRVQKNPMFHRCHNALLKHAHYIAMCIFFLSHYNI